MNVDLQLPPDIEAKLQEQAAHAGLDVESFVAKAIAEKLCEAEPLPRREKTGWAARLQACIDLHPEVTHFVDDSRESIYEGRGE